MLVLLFYKGKDAWKQGPAQNKINVNEHFFRLLIVPVKEFYKKKSLYHNPHPQHWLNLLQNRTSTHHCQHFSCSRNSFRIHLIFPIHSFEINKMEGRKFGNRSKVAPKYIYKIFELEGSSCRVSLEGKTTMHVKYSRRWVAKPIGN